MPTSPLRYPGGKTRAIRVIAPLLLDAEEITSPFAGGCSIEIHMAHLGKRVRASDSFALLVDFWREALSNPAGLADEARDYLPLSRRRFRELQSSVGGMRHRIHRAAAFYALNRASFSGAGLCGGMSPGHPRWNSKALDRLASFKAPSLSVKRMPFEKAIAKRKGRLYLDPPYLVGSSLYGVKGSHHDGFDHEGLAEILRNEDDWVLSYGDHPTIRSLYRGFRIRKAEWSYGMNGSKKSSEIIITDR